jgi:3-hydroxyacyl-[acyl-carrier-protein] dehydratase
MRLEYFQMVDRITALDLDAQTIEAECRVPEQSPIFEGHFPGYPLLPGTLMFETIAQVGGWLIIVMQRFERVPLLGQVREGKARAFVSPGEILTGGAKLRHTGSGYAVIAGTLRRGAKLVAEAEITYRVIPPPLPTMRPLLFETARKLGIAEHHIDA